MSTTPASLDFTRLPLILAGPIVRRTDPDAIAVWVALQQPRQVTLKIYETEAGQGKRIDREIASGSRHTVRLGQRLHVVVVTADIPAGFQPGCIYAYDMDFGATEPTLQQGLSVEGTPTDAISYFDHQLPTFVTPPDDLNHLRLVHGSCRKPHGGGRDTLPLVDTLMEQSADVPLERPQQLFLTGDQIYGDDVADPLLWQVTQWGNTLLGWEEQLPRTHGKSYSLTQFLPGQRSDIAHDWGGLTAMLANKPEKAKSHLFGLGEYFAMYLCAWSPVLWQNRPPSGRDVAKTRKQAKQWNWELRDLDIFARDLWQVRRALANISTYTICDDHDVTDDWYLNREWCDRVLTKPFGRRVVQNGMAAYAIFQGWGNTPAQFAPGQPGADFLEAIARWSESAGTDKVAEVELEQFLALPKVDSKTDLPQYDRDEDVSILHSLDPADPPELEWHYTLRSFKHEVVVLDTRTWRGYPDGDGMTPPMLLSPSAFERQIQTSLDQSERDFPNIEATFIILPTNLVSLSAIDWIQEFDLERGNVFAHDVGDSWNFNEAAQTRLLSVLFNRRDRIIALSGDIHYACAVRLSYRSTMGDRVGVLAQLTSSAIKNAELITYLVHTKLKSIAPEPVEYWAGWQQPPELVEVVATPGQVRQLPIEVGQTGPILRKIQAPRGNDKIAWHAATKDKKSLPDWRYQIEWIERQSAQLVPFSKRKIGTPPFHPFPEWLSFVGDWFSRLWRNRWFQEGTEVVGRNNISLVSLQWSVEEGQKMAIQQTYWHPPWKPTRTVQSRYCVPLESDRIS
jgi:hypothetical protein